MTATIIFEQQSLDELEQACKRETRRHIQGVSSDGRFCLEIFRRAIALVSTVNSSTPVYPDEPARELLVSIYTDFIKANINRKIVRTPPIEDLVQQVWLRFWQAARARLVFVTLEAALSYLKLATATTIIEARRRERQRGREESLEQEVASSGDSNLVDTHQDSFTHHVKRRFDARCRELLVDPLERRVFWMRYSMGFAPREIAREFSQIGVLVKDRPPTARLISDLLDACFKRLEADPEIRDLLRSD